jgi:hypothetical protein
MSASDVLDDPLNVLEPQNTDTTNTDHTNTDIARAVSLSQEEYDRLTSVASNYDNLAREVSDLRNRQAQPVQQQAPAPQGQQVDPALRNQQFWQDPVAMAEALATDKARELMRPVAEQFANALGNQAITNFRMEQMSDPYYGAVKATFDKKVASLNATWLGSLTADQQRSALSEAWNASLGEYVSTERAKRPAQRPTNIGGGGGGGSSVGGVKTLQEVDPVAYAWAKRNGLSDEDMAEIAKDALASRDE